MLMIMSMTISIIFTLLSHPVSISMTIFLQTIMVCLICGLLTNLFWFSYMLFLVMVGGLLVLFLYMTNVASNEKFKTSKIIMLIFVYSMMNSLMFTYSDKFFYFMNCSLWNSNLNNTSVETILMKFFNYPSMMITIMVMIYLLLTMIMSVKITNLKSGALRQKF